MLNDIRNDRAIPILSVESSVWKSKAIPCSYYACQRPGHHGANGFGYCKMHYNKIWRLGLHKKLQKKNKVNVLKCMVVNCENKYWAKGLCNMHLKRKRKEKPLI